MIIHIKTEEILVARKLLSIYIYIYIYSKAKISKKFSKYYVELKEKI